MEVYLRIDINLASMILLGIVFAIAFVRLERQDTINRVFLYTSGAILIELALETLTCIINRRPETFLIPFSVALHVCLFITAPILTYFWFTFIRCWILPEEVRAQKRELLLLIPVILNVVMVLLSPVFGLVFSIDDANMYHRGPFFGVSAAIVYFYILASLYLILRKRKRLVWQEFLPLFAFGILPLLGGLLQSLFYGILLMWSCTALSLVIVYIFLQQRMVHLDKLTGVWTRASFDHYVAQRTEYVPSELLGVIFIDMDGLKQINDSFGHYEGDCAIRTAVHLIRQALRKTDVFARFGGDEFVVALNCATREELDGVMERIERNFKEHNRVAQKGYRLECSLGGDLFDADSDSIEPFLIRVDQLMYNNKRNKKARSPLV